MRTRPLAIFLVFSCLLSACRPSGENPDASMDEAAANGAGRQAPDAAFSETPEERAARLQATFPAQQRPPQDPELVEDGLEIYTINCRACHGQDLRGGDMGGPNLLRSDIVLSDNAGEMIGAVIREGRSRPGMTPMPALPLGDHEVEAVAAYIHSIEAQGQRQGAPPPSEVELDIVVGNADSGAAHFTALCSECHSVTGDLAGLAGRISNPADLQISWVAGRHWGMPIDNADPARMVTATVRFDDGSTVSGRLLRRDDFMLSLITATGNYRSISLTHGSPAVTDIEINDPLARHLALQGELRDDVMHDITAYLVTLK